MAQGEGAVTVQGVKDCQRTNGKGINLWGQKFASNTKYEAADTKWRDMFFRSKCEADFKK